MNAGTAPMRPVSGISTASSASEGMVCTMPVMPRIAASVAGRRAARMPSGTPIDDARRQRDEHQHQVLGGQAGEVGCEELLPEAAGRRCGAVPLAGACAPCAPVPGDDALRDEIRARSWRSRALELGRGVHADHRGLVDAAARASAARPRSSAGASAGRRDTAAPRRSAENSCDRPPARQARTCRSSRRSSRCRSRRPGRRRAPRTRGRGRARAASRTADRTRAQARASRRRGR